MFARIECKVKKQDTKASKEFSMVDSGHLLCLFFCFADRSGALWPWVHYNEMDRPFVEQKWHHHFMGEDTGVYLMSNLQINFQTIT